MQINRLFEIVYLLLERKTMTAKELANRFEVSTKTIYRDVDLLSQAKIPIYANKGKGGGICLLEDYVFDKSLISEEEQNQILFALQGMNKIGMEEEKDILEKMSQLFQKRKTNWIEVDFSNWGTNGKTDKTFSIIKEAILKQKVLEFIYYNSYGEKKKRQVEPLQIYFKDKAWYLKAYCRKKLDYRLFKISRIQNLKVLEEKFERELPILKEERTEIKTVTLKLEISKEMAYRVYDEFQEQEIRKKKNGDFKITVTYPSNDWVYGYLLSFGEWLKVISPIEVKKEIQKKLEKSLENYLK